MNSGFSLPNAAIVIAAMFALSFTSKAEHANEKSFARSVKIASKPETVWNALTKKVHVDKYYLAPLGADLASAESEIFYGSPENKMIVGEVTIFEPPMRLTHTFRFSGRDGAKTSYVTYWIKPIDGGSKLTVSHVGYKADSQDFGDISAGWPIILSGLKSYLEK